MNGVVLSVNISEKKGVPKTPISEGFFKKDFGLEGDGHAGGNPVRQVTLLSVETIEEMSALGIQGLKPGMIAENITTKGIEIYKLPIGTRLKIGEAIMEISMIGKECEKPENCSLHIDVKKCIAKERIVFVKVIEGGNIKLGDKIKVIEEE
ncbi:MOSC domain-containing protein [Aceticella autotrophica]|uniref:MOSC domain-containing protein n=1 Tax=Aceticella autotrophica TaxID=2755338 RepID=A0A975GAG8_9THEO|nr:MOSC domain-containing protein [Aceticella autotrophica]QSZ27265.1 MOSC domain-containing protein [Aceticella autotrophica]